MILVLVSNSSQRDISQNIQHIQQSQSKIMFTPFYIKPYTKQQLKTIITKQSGCQKFITDKEMEDICSSIYERHQSNVDALFDKICQMLKFKVKNLQSTPNAADAKQQN